MNMFFKTLIGAVAGFIPVLSSGQHFESVTQWGGSHRVLPPSIYVDQNGHTLLFGSFLGTCDFDPQSGQTILGSGSDQKTYFMELDNSHALVENGAWIFKSTPDGFVGGAKILPGANGDFYLIGVYNGTILNSTNVSLSQPSADSSNDCFVAKLNASHELIWLQDFGAGGLEFVRDAAYNSTTDELILLGASSNGSETNLDPENPADVIPYTVGNISFISRLNGSTGALIGYGIISRENTTAFLDMKHLEIDAAGNIYACGNFQGNLAINGTQYAQSFPNDYDDAFILKWNPQLNGNPEWIHVIGDLGREHVSTLNVSESGAIYLSGTYHEPFEFGGVLLQNEFYSNMDSEYAENVFVIRFSTDGSINWTRWFGSNDYEEVTAADIYENHLILTGTYKSSTVIGSDTLNVPEGIESPTYIFILPMDTLGNFSTPVQYGFTDGWYDRTREVYITENRILISGTYESYAEADFDPDPDNNTHTLPAGEDETAYLLELAFENTAGVSEISHKQPVVYPNPVKDQLFIQSGDQPVISAKVMSLTGELTKATLEGNVLDLQTLAQGTYLVQIITKSGVYNYPVTKK